MPIIESPYALCTAGLLSLEAKPKHVACYYSHIQKVLRVDSLQCPQAILNKRVPPSSVHGLVFH